MMTTNANTLYVEAKKRMQAIDHEVNRPAEDAVPQFIFNSARQCAHDFLMAFIDDNGVTPKEPVSLESLLQQCKTIDPRFLSIDSEELSCFMAANQEDLQQTIRCYDVAGRLEQLVRYSDANRL